MARQREEPAKLQKEFLSFAEHWGFEVLASPPYWPRVKGKVERAIRYLKESFLEGREFETLDELNGQLRQWLAEIANVRVHGTTGVRPVDRLAEDQAAMLPFARRPFPATERETRQVDHDSRLSFGGVRYSVDPEIVQGRRTTSVEVCLGTDERLRIYQGERLVGDHRRMPSGSPAQDDPRHAAARRRQRQEPSFERPRGSAPRFDQKVPEAPDLGQLLGPAPAVEHRPLAAYEGGA